MQGQNAIRPVSRGTKLAGAGMVLAMLAGCGATNERSSDPNREVTTLAEERIREAGGSKPAAPVGVVSHDPSTARPGGAALTDAGPNTALGKQWMFTSVGGYDGELPKGPNNASILLSRGSGRVVGTTSCNRLSATFRMSPQEGTLHFDNIVTGNAMCGEPNVSVEDAVVEALRTCDSFRLDGARLSLLSGGAVVAELTTP